uniref:Uncharacterized protein n=1 Tax=Sinocyclocheilus grahami TaxID=75366 RepID=A0A672L939_SINGR
MPSVLKSFQFKNVEYSSGRNKTFLCYQVDIQGGAGETDGLRGYLEDDDDVNLIIKWLE